MRGPRGIAFWGFILAMTAGRSVGSPPDSVVRPVGEARGAARITLRVQAPTVSLVGNPEGRQVIRVEGFGERTARPGAPDIPFKTLKVAIPEGAAPRVGVRLLEDEDLRPGARPEPVAALLADQLFDFDDDVRADMRPMSRFAEPASSALRRYSTRFEDPAVYEGRSTYPGAVAELGPVGVLRDQRYVELRVAPVRYDPAIRGLRIARSFEVTIDFGDGVSNEGEPAEDPRFESVYRSAFVNYAQGRAFRLSSSSAASASSRADRLALEPSATASWGRRFTVGPPSRSDGSQGHRRLAGSNDGAPLYRIRIRKTGPVRLDHGRVSGTGLDSEPLSRWKLTSHGVELPLFVFDPNGNDLLEPGEWVQFYGQALDFEPKTALNTDEPNSTQDIYEARDFSDENVYFVGAEAGTRLRMLTRDATPTMTRPPAADFEGWVHVETDSAWRPLGGADPWYWSPTQSNPQQISLVPQRTVSVDLPGAVPSASARVRVNLRGITEDNATTPDHASQVTLQNESGQTLATSFDDGTFDGRAIYLHDFGWTYPGSGATLTSPAQVVVDALPVAGSAGYYNQFILDWIEIGYRRTFAASGDELTFAFPDGDAEFVVSGLADPAPQVWEITSRLGTTALVDAVRLAGAAVAGAGPYSVRFRIDDDPALPPGSLRQFVVAGSGSVSVPAGPDFTADTVSDLRNTSIQADLIVLAHPDVLDASTGSPLDRLLNFRASQGISSKIARIEDVQDEFNDGIPGPVAIRNFLRWVMSTTPGEGWALPKPSFLLILGDGSYDYKGGTAKGNYVPTQILFKDFIQLGYYASDSLLGAAVGDDQMADLAVGRISARSVSEANTVLAKIVDYEQSAPSGSWRRNSIFVSDRGKRNPATGRIDVAESLDFEATNDAGEGFIARPPYTSRKLRYYSDYCDFVTDVCDPTRITADIKAAVNGTDGFSDGGAIFQFEGHGNFDVWGDDAIFDERAPNPDTDDLVNGLRLPWVLAHDCLSGGFHTTAATSLGENWMKRSGGGAVALFSPTNLTFNFVGRTATEVIFNDLFGPRKERDLLVPVMATWAKFCSQGTVDACQAYALHGDPALRLALPDVAPATAVQAVGGNARVDLSWTASATAGARYDVYRTTDLYATSYDKVTASPVSATAFADAGLSNTVTYYYYVVALDAEGFESRWSNFNSDCAVDGPDCVEATPLNPNPPGAPTGVTVTDPATGGRLNVSWLANPENDIRYYEVFWGLVAGTPEQVRNVGRSTSTVLTDLANGTAYWVAVKATNTSGLTSGYSAWVSGVPTAPPKGLTAPQWIRDLRVDKSGQDARLSWSAVTTDIWGGAETVSAYEIYRGPTPDFVPGPANRIGTTAATTFTDPGALGTGTPAYHYLVRAVDAAGNAGGLGGQLPQGIDLLRVDRAPTAGWLRLSWPAVTTDVDNHAARIARYDVYYGDKPFRRADVRDGKTPPGAPISSTSGTSIDLAQPAGNGYYSVIVVDAKGNLSPF